MAATEGFSAISLGNHTKQVPGSRMPLTLWNSGNPTSSNVSAITCKEDGQQGGWVSEPERIAGRIKQDVYQVPQRAQSRKATLFKHLLVTVRVTMIKYQDEQQQPLWKEN